MKTFSFTECTELIQTAALMELAELAGTKVLTKDNIKRKKVT